MGKTLNNYLKRLDLSNNSRIEPMLRNCTNPLFEIILALRFPRKLKNDLKGGKMKDLKVGKLGKPLDVFIRSNTCSEHKLYPSDILIPSQLLIIAQVDHGNRKYKGPFGPSRKSSQGSMGYQ
jgi:hypothetical protein